MIELIGGPFDGRTYARNPGHEVFIGPAGQLRRREGLAGDMRYLEEGVCRGCGVRSGKTGHRLFVLEQLASTGNCALCGKQTA